MAIPASPSSILVADRVWDGTAAATVAGKAVVVEGDTISAVIEVADIGHLEGFATDRVRRFEGCTLLPGLIDGHTHLSEWMLPSFLAAGVTTVRDTGGDLPTLLRMRQTADTHPATSPRILGTGPVLDGPTVTWSRIGRAHADPAAIVASVDELADAGVDAIKLYTGVTAAQMAAATHAAHERELPVLAHLGAAGIVAAAEAGVDEVQHLSGVVDTALADGARPDPGAIAAAAAIPWHCTTLVVWDRLARSRDAVFDHDERHRWVHPAILAAWRRFPHRHLAPAATTDRQAAVVAMKRVLPTILARGSRLLTGTDTPWPWLVPGGSLHDELGLLQDAGITRSEVLVAATSDAAAALRRDDLGRVVAGARADLVIVQGDPTRSLTDLRRIVHVVRDGVSVDLVGLARAAERAHREPADAPIDDKLIEFADRRAGPVPDTWDEPAPHDPGPDPDPRSAPSRTAFGPPTPNDTTSPPQP